jgi:hypothetical protein
MSHSTRDAAIRQVPWSNVAKRAFLVLGFAILYLDLI